MAFVKSDERRIRHGGYFCLSLFVFFSPLGMKASWGLGGHVHCPLFL